MSLRSASAGSSKVLDDDGGPLAQKLAQYAGLLASQGALDAALTYLQGDSAGVGELAELRERLSGAIGRKRSISHSAPTAPASRVAGKRMEMTMKSTHISGKVAFHRWLETGKICFHIMRMTHDQNAYRIIRRNINTSLFSVRSKIDQN